MTRFFCLVFVATATGLFCVSGCQRLQNNDQPKPDVNGNLVAQEKDPPKPPNPYTNNLGMKFVWIPPGSFIMGIPKEKIESVTRLNPLTGEPGGKKIVDAAKLRYLGIKHRVTLTKGFYMGVYTVTQEQWKELMGNNPSIFQGEKNLPVENVSWDDCQQFIKKLREKDRKLYRLPTEAEWEYTCRAGTATLFHFGDTLSTDQANINGEIPADDLNSRKGVFRGKTTPVGTFPANAWGLHDMHGNVQQWCQDWFEIYPEKDVVDPQGPEKGDNRVVRGGSFFTYAESATSSRRSGGLPRDKGPNIGCRLCFFVE